MGEIATLSMTPRIMILNLMKEQNVMLNVGFIYSLNVIMLNVIAPSSLMTVLFRLTILNCPTTVSCQMSF
jgi:hypothetical protein